MSNIRYNPFRPLKPFQIDKFLDDVSSRSISDFFGTEFVSITPAVNVIEAETNFQIEVAAPGLDKEDFDVELDNDQLIISAKVEGSADAETSGKITRKEFNYQSFKRSFHVGDDIISDQIAAAYKDGVLTITLPKKEEVNIKTNIEIK